MWNTSGHAVEGTEHATADSSLLYMVEPILNPSRVHQIESIVVKMTNEKQNATRQTSRCLAIVVNSRCREIDERDFTLVPPLVGQP